MLIFCEKNPAEANRNTRNGSRWVSGEMVSHRPEEHSACQSLSQNPCPTFRIL
jgi:hypothetical protein